MAEDDLDRLTEMLRIIQQSEPKPEASSGRREEFKNTGRTREEIRAAADQAEATAKADPSYEFTNEVIDRALVEMFPYALGNESPFDAVMVKQLGLNAFAMKRHLADMLVKALKSLPENIGRAFIEDVENGQILMSMLAFAVTEMVFIANKAHELAQGVDGHPLNGK